MKTRVLGAAALAVALLMVVAFASVAAAGPLGPAASSTATTTTPLPLPTTPTSTTPTTTTPAPTTTTPAPTTTTTTTPAPTPKPAAARARLFLSGLVRAGRDADVTVPHRTVTVTAVVRPYVADQRVLIQAFDRGRLILHRLAYLKASPRRVDGRLVIHLQAPRSGTVAVRLVHSPSTTLSAFRTERRYHVLSESVHLGSTGPFVALLQARLAALHLWIPRTGVFDEGTELALDAYHRLLGEGEGDVSVTPATVSDLLDGRGAFHVRFPGQGRHAEGDLSIQDLALIDGSKVQYIFPISSGKPSTPTVLGSWQIYRRQPGYLPDGMYYSDFFTGGYAIHGYDPAPDYPASHGCMRLPIVDAIPAYDWLALGDWVDSYYT